MGGKKFIVVTDSSCDLTQEICKQNDLYCINLGYSDGVNQYVNDMNPSKYKEFYENMRHGVVYKTTQVNYQEYYDFFEKLVCFNKPVMYIGLTLALSNSLTNAQMAYEDLKEKYPDFEMYIVDSLVASSGVALIALKACRLRDNEMDACDAYQIILDTAKNEGVYYTTDTLTYFARGGRLSKTSALIARALGINIILDCEPSGKLRVVQKIRGRAKAKRQIIENAKKEAVNPENNLVYVCHADCYDEAVELGKALVKEVGFSAYFLTDMGPIIGAHTGPGLLTIFFEGVGRKETR